MSRRPDRKPNILLQDEVQQVSDTGTNIQIMQTQPSAVFSQQNGVCNPNERKRTLPLENITNISPNFNTRIEIYYAEGVENNGNDISYQPTNVNAMGTESVYKRRSSRLKFFQDMNKRIDNSENAKRSRKKTERPIALETAYQIDARTCQRQDSSIAYTRGSNSSKNLVITEDENLNFSSLSSASQCVSNLEHRPVNVKGVDYRNTEFSFDHNGNHTSDEEDEIILEKEDDHTACDNSLGDYEHNHESYNTIEYMDEGDQSHKCKHCGAWLWYNERVKTDKKRNANMFNLCCLGGKVQLPAMKAPPQALFNLFFDKTSVQSKSFYSNIRQYNNMFSFTSMGGKVDHAMNCGQGPYSFVLSGMNYHCIGSLLPPEGCKPVYSQLYIYDTENEVANRINAVSKHQSHSDIDPTLVQIIKDILDDVNPFVQHYRFASEMINSRGRSDMKMRLINSRNTDGRVYNLPSASEVAALVVGDFDMSYNVRDIIIEELSGRPKRINELHTAYLPLQYPLLFPYGEDGYRDDVEHREETLAKTKKRKRLSMREYFTYRLMSRENETSVILHASRLLQQFVVDGYTMIEAQRLHWVRTHQKELRVELYQGLSDAITNGERDASSIGKRIILPSSFTGGARYMLQNYQDAMALCRWAGYPDIFITFTCNPAWPEIKRICEHDMLTPSDSPQLLSRIFKMKLQSMMRTIKNKKIFGRVRAEVYTIEFQKRGLPHAHILLFLDHSDKIKEPSDIDNIISAEIPDKESDPILYDLVKRFMIHGPCGAINPKSPCMKDNKCSKYFPKRFNLNTTIDDEGYPTYRRRDHGHTIKVKSVPLDSRYVVPYNPMLLKMFQAHINVEKCNQSTSIKYLFKYISKGNDRVVAGIFDANGGFLDEIQQYYNFRYISACEATWRIFGFDIHHRHPSIERLSYHLPNQQLVIYSNNDDVTNLLNKPRVCESQFLAWMKTNQEGGLARTLTYAEFPNHFVYHRDKREWRPRKKGFSVGRITNASPSSGELYYLRILLTKVRGPRSYEEIRTVNDVLYPTFREACFALGLLDDDKEFICAIKEAAIWATGTSLRKMFVSMLLSGCLSRLDLVWQGTSKVLSEDLLYIPHGHPNISRQLVTLDQKEQVALRDIEKLLQANGKSLLDFPSLPLPLDTLMIDVSNHLILQELNYNKEDLQHEATRLVNALNDEQRKIFDKVMSSIAESSGCFFFVYGYGGTGKTFLWNALTSSLRAKGEIVITVASSGIAATLLPGGRTAHSRFAIPIQVNEFSVCAIKQNSPLANLIQSAKLIIWDEAPMVQRYCIEAVDRSFKDIMHSNKPFGGKCMLMGGDFRQILPVIPKGTRAVVVNASISSSHLWRHCTIFKLTKNMRLTSSSGDGQIQIQKFSNWLLEVGDGKIGLPHDGVVQIEIPKEILISKYTNAMEAIVSATYGDLVYNFGNQDFFSDRAILAPTIDHVNQLNEYMCQMLPGESYEYLSCDTVCKSSEDTDCFENLYTTEFLNTINSSGLPPHKLILKVGAPIMLLRNIDQAAGLCNGTRLIVSHLGKNVIEGVTLNGCSISQKVLLHRMDMNPSESRWPFRLRRRQFPVTLSFAMTINKSQGQSLKNVGLYLTKPVFSHGQLYVALSRVKSIDGLKVVVDENGGCCQNTTINVVYREIFNNLP